MTNARLAMLELSPSGYFPGAPDLAVEVLSPDDSHSDEGLLPGWSVSVGELLA